MMTATALISIDSCPIEGFIPRDVESALAKEGIFDTKVESIAVMAAFESRASDPIHPKTRCPLEEIVKIIM